MGNDLRTFLFFLKNNKDNLNCAEEYIIKYLNVHTTSQDEYRRSVEVCEWLLSNQAI